MAKAQASDVTVRRGRADPPSAEEISLIEARLNDVERRILRKLARAGRVLEDDLDDGVIELDDLKAVEAEAVLRLVRNPEGFIQETDGNYTYLLSEEAASTKLRIDPEEWELLGFYSRRVFTLQPTLDMPV